MASDMESALDAVDAVGRMAEPPADDLIVRMPMSEVLELIDRAKAERERAVARRAAE